MPRYGSVVYNSSNNSDNNHMVNSVVPEVVYEDTGVFLVKFNCLFFTAFFPCLGNTTSHGPVVWTPPKRVNNN